MRTEMTAQGQVNKEAAQRFHRLRANERTLVTQIAAAADGRNVQVDEQLREQVWQDAQWLAQAAGLGQVRHMPDVAEVLRVVKQRMS